MRPLAFLFTLLILGACAKDENGLPAPTPLSLEDQILAASNNALFVDALKCSDLDLSGREFTLLMPSEEALQNFLDDLGAQNFEELKEKIGSDYFKAWFASHILPQAAKIENLHTAFIPTMAHNSAQQPIYIYWQREKSVVKINGQWINLQSRDQELNAGMMHQIEQVLNPSTLSKLVRAHSENFSILERALRMTNLSSTLNNDRKRYTLLAPSDQAFDLYFQDLNCGDLDGYLSKYGSAQLKELLEAHLIRGSHKLSTLSGSQRQSLSPNHSLFFVLDNGNITVKRSANDITNSAQVLITDISGFNGSLNIINEVLKLP